MAKHRSIESYIESPADRRPITYQATITTGKVNTLLDSLKKRGAVAKEIVVPKEGEFALLFDEESGRLLIFPRQDPIFDGKFARESEIYDFPVVGIDSDDIRQILTGADTDPDINKARKKRSRVTHWPVKLPETQRSKK